MLLYDSLFYIHMGKFIWLEPFFKPWWGCYWFSTLLKYKPTKKNNYTGKANCGNMNQAYKEWWKPVTTLCISWHLFFFLQLFCLLGENYLFRSKWIINALFTLKAEKNKLMSFFWLNDYCYWCCLAVLLQRGMQ